MRLPVLPRGQGPVRLGHREGERRGLQRRAAVGERRLDEVHRRRADEGGDEEVRGLLVDLERRPHLLELAVLHDGDAVAHRHRLDLVVRDVDRRRLQAVLELADLGAHLDAELGVEVRERLVEEEDGGLSRDGPADRDPLPLAARELLRLAVEELRDAEHLGGLVHELVHLGLGRLADLQAELEVLPDRHVRVERVALEDHGDVAVLRGHVVHDAVADGDGAVGDLLEPRDHPQGRRLAAARRPDEDHELVVLDLEVQALDDGDVAVALGDLLEDDLSHAGASSVRCRAPGWRRSGAEG